MDFRTYVELPKKELEIKHTNGLLLLGSCFAENIGNLLMDNKFDCDVNPFGVLYNPLSILEGLQEIYDGKVYEEADLFFYKEAYHSYMHHSSFSNISSKVCLNNINTRLNSATNKLIQTNYLLITFGTAFVYELKDSGQIVANCHKLPDKSFTRRLLSVNEIVEAYTSFITIHPDKKILFSVSPIRHVKDGMHGNQLSKATLLMSIQQLQEAFPNSVYYFPSYELMMDELRDYRFYADDMLHPSALAINYLWNCFVKSYFSRETQQFIKEWTEIKKALNHKPFQVSSQQYKTFLRQIVLKIEGIKEKCPYLDVEKELKLCRILLTQ
ncbi:MAG: GSCFA domain-containing protein [Bacteroidaceae bacterium]